MGALVNPNSVVCREFTDLFIALARSAGIPTREVDGFAYTANTKQRPLSLVQDVLHAWPEYYDLQKKTWVMVDPTWGSTTGGVDYFSALDFDHIAFIVKGKDDNYPIPAGGYKSSDEKSLKDVEVKFSNTNSKKNQDIQISTSLPPQLTAGSPINFDIKIVNNGPALLPKKPLYIESTQLTPIKQAFEIPVIPPYGYLIIKGSLDKTSILTKKESVVKIFYSEKSITTKNRITPFFLNIYGIGGVVIGIFTLIILIIAGKSGRLRLHR